MKPPGGDVLGLPETTGTTTRSLKHHSDQAIASCRLIYRYLRSSISIDGRLRAICIEPRISDFPEMSIFRNLSQMSCGLTSISWNINRADVRRADYVEVALHDINTSLFCYCKPIDMNKASNINRLSPRLTFFIMPAYTTSMYARDVGHREKSTKSDVHLCLRRGHCMSTATQRP